VQAGALTFRAPRLFATAVDVLRLIIGFRLVILRVEPSISGIPITRAKLDQQAPISGEAKNDSQDRCPWSRLSAATGGEAHETS
jgi:hypothetical protein